MNNLVINVCAYGTEPNVEGTNLGDLTLKPIFDLDRGKAWHGTIKVGDNTTIGVYAYSLHDAVPEAKRYPKVIG